ncbi:MAG: transglycosylase domain-containing protein [Bacteroidia bacterium]
MTASKKKPGNAKTNYSRSILGFWIILTGGLLSIVLLYFAISWGVFGPLPDPQELENPQTPEASIVFSSDGKILGKYYKENRTPIDYDRLGENLENALVATEDARFKSHSGIDFRGLARVFFKTVVLQQNAGGGSTITQQLAKNLFHEKPRSMIGRIKQKLKEWVIATELERRYTKEEIITMYFNTVDFGSNTYGIRSAAKTFFNKAPDSLTVPEAAILVGVLKATTYYSPVSNPENSRLRRNVVMKQMNKYGYITQEEYDSLKKTTIELNYQVESHSRGLATYFREHLRGELGKWARERGFDLYRDGLQIYTTIDSRMQQYAEEAVKEHLPVLQGQFYSKWEDIPISKADEEKILTDGIRRSDRYWQLKNANPEYTMDDIKEIFSKPVEMKVFSWRGEIDTTMSPLDSVKYHKMFFHPGMMAMDQPTGQIKAWVGGIDYKYFQYDHVNIQAKRQVGSTFKPFVYTAGIVVNKYSPCMEVPNQRVTFEDFKNWSPKNSDGEYGGMYSLKAGLAKSVNTITAWVMKRVGPEQVAKFAHYMGIESEIPPYPSIALGTPDISVFEMVGAYNTFGNKGSWVQPNYLTHISDKNGNEIASFQPRIVEVLDEGYNYVMLELLKGVTQYGTGLRLRGSKYNMRQEIAGKTGTTQNNSDGWFIGVVPELTAGVWVGAEDRAVHFRSTALGQGANMALPIWALFINKVNADPILKMTKTEFDRPEEDLPVEINCSLYKKDQMQDGLGRDDLLGFP